MDFLTVSAKKQVEGICQLWVVSIGIHSQQQEAPVSLFLCQLSIKN